MAKQQQGIDNSHVQDSQIQQNQAGRDTVSFQNSHDNQVTINNAIVQLFGSRENPDVDWDWAMQLMEEHREEICKRLTDTLGRDRHLMSITLEEQRTWVGRPSPLQAKRQLQVDGTDQGILDTHQLLIEAFSRDDIGGKLLILGTPGAGKTTALLSLAKQLVCGAIEQPKTVIPVIFELSTWRRDNQSIEGWLIERLYERYPGNRKAKRYERWIEQQVLLPLFDGLDELGLELQELCTRRLQEFTKNYPFIKTVVCCRLKEFETVGLKLKKLRGAISLAPLSDKQIQSYLEMTGRPQLWTEFQTNPTLRNFLEPTEEEEPGLLRVPLFVSLAARVYDPQHPFQSKADLLKQYVDRQLSRDVRESDRFAVDGRSWTYKTLTKEPRNPKTQRTLRWIATHLNQENQVELLIERIQPSWLKNHAALSMYHSIISGVIGATILLIFISLWQIEIYIKLPLVGTFLAPLIMAYSIYFWYLPRSQNDVINNAIRPAETLIGTPISLLIKDIFKVIENAIRNILISKEIIFNLSVGIFFLPEITVIVIFIYCYCLIAKLVFEIVVDLFRILANFFQGSLKTCVRPNQGIRNSLLNMFLVIFLTYPIFSFLIFFLIRYVQEEARFPLMWLTFSISLGISTLLGFMVGGYPYLQHYCLRFVLWQRGIAPWDLPRFLNYCVERRLLHRVGGRYRFLHRELLDYFAEQKF